MLTRKNLDINPGIQSSYRFDILDSTFLKVDLTGYTFKLEILNKKEELILVLNTPSNFGLGFVVFSVSSIESRILTNKQYFYRLVITSVLGVSQVVYRGFLTCSSPLFDINGTPSSSIITLPDGTIYPLTAVTIVPDQWYSLATFFRFLVSGVGKTSIDGRGNTGIIELSVTFFENTLVDEAEWNPGLLNFNSFRTHQLTGTNLVRYLP